jgi:hypothetical protein
MHRLSGCQEGHRDTLLVSQNSVRSYQVIINQVKATGSIFVHGMLVGSGCPHLLGHGDSYTIPLFVKFIELSYQSVDLFLVESLLPGQISQRSPEGFTADNTGQPLFD